MTDPEDRGPVRACATPPMDARATVVVGESVLTTVGVPEGDAVNVHAAATTQGESLDHYPDADDIPDPDTPFETDGDPTDSFTPRSRSWATVTVDGERRARFAVVAEEPVALYLEPENHEKAVSAGVDSGRDPEGSAGENGGSP